MITRDRAVRAQCNTRLVAYLRTLPDGMMSAAIDDLAGVACGSGDEKRERMNG